MRKSFLTLMLAIVSSVWMMSEASDRWCMPSIRTTAEPWIEVNGAFQAEGFPCEPDEECLPCVTIVLVTSDKTYYLVTDDGQLIEYLDTIPLGTKATVSGIPFEHGSYNYIEVHNIEIAHTPLRLNSLCNEWNVWHESFESFGPISFDKVVKYQLTTDTLINGQQYVKLTSDKDSPYLGAMREGNNRDIYYVPAGSTNEFLLYAFNAQVGEVLNDLYLGGFEENGYSGRVEAISDGSPRLFTIRVLYPDGMGVEPGESFSVTWIEGVGSPETPYGLAVVPTVPAEVGIYTLLCAYKNGEQIYVSEMGAEYGCEHDLTPEPTDTIPLYSYTGDDPGSSTVDPVDPNQVVAILRGNQLTIQENTGADVTYALHHNSPAETPSRNRAPQNDTFRDEVTIQITESGEYLLQLTNPSWEYTIFGQFSYAPQGINDISNDLLPITHKVIKDGHLLILRGERVYTLTGQEVR